MPYWHRNDSKLRLHFRYILHYRKSSISGKFVAPQSSVKCTTSSEDFTSRYHRHDDLIPTNVGDQFAFSSSDSYLSSGEWRLSLMVTEYLELVFALASCLEANSFVRSSSELDSVYQSVISLPEFQTVSVHQRLLTEIREYSTLCKQQLLRTMHVAWNWLRNFEFNFNKMLANYSYTELPE